jgi:hypothetical protein
MTPFPDYEAAVRKVLREEHHWPEALQGHKLIPMYLESYYQRGLPVWEAASFLDFFANPPWANERR